MTKDKIKRLKEYILPISIIVFVGIIGLVGIYFYEKGKSAIILPRLSIIGDNTECKSIRNIDGECLMEYAKDLGVFAVMIDNLKEARPQSGLSQASLVYEAVAEGNITRFLAIFSLNKNINKIGPIRSARSYFVRLAKEFNCPYLHVGGSPEALDYLSSSYKFDLNEISRGQYFYRDTNRYAPHNVYSDTSQVERAIKKYQWEVTDDFESFIYRKEVLDKDSLGSVERVALDFGSSDFAVEWIYDRENNVYKRRQGGTFLMDENTNKIVSAKNIIVMLAKYSVIDSYGRQKIEDLDAGTGKVYVFLDGKVISGTWQLKSKNGRRQFFDDNNEEISFNVGQTWIELLPLENKLTY